MSFSVLHVSVVGLNDSAPSRGEGGLRWKYPIYLNPFNERDPEYMK